MVRAALIALGLVFVVIFGALGGAAYVRFGLDDAGRGRFAAGVLTRLLPGQFEIARIGYTGAGDLTIGGVRIVAPDGVEVARADAIEATFQWAPLLHKEVVFGPVHCHHPWVRVEEMPEHGAMRIETAFQLPPHHEEHVQALPKVGGVKVWLQNVDVHSADLRVHVGDVEVATQGLEIRAADYWVQGDAMELSAQLDTALAVKSPVITQTVNAIHVDASQVHYLTAHAYDDVSAQRLNVGWEGCDLNISGQLFADMHGLQHDEATVSFSIDAAQPIVRMVLPTILARDLRGWADGHASIKKHDDDQRVSLALKGKNLGWRHINLDELNVRGGFAAGEASLDRFHWRDDKALLDVTGGIAWIPGLVGRHKIAVEGTQVPLQKVLGPFVAHPGLLPEVVTFMATSAGRSLWPMTAEVHFKAQAWGVPASWLPGVPDPLLLDATAVMHPDAVEILRLQLGGHDSQMALQGTLPFAKLGVVEVIHDLHRIPTKAVAD